jgi:hypothetical protein
VHKLKLRRSIELKVLIKRQHVRQHARQNARQNARKGMPEQLSRRPCVRQKKHNNDMRLNKRRQLGEPELFTKKPNGIVERKSKPSRQGMPLARRPRRPRHELRKMLDEVTLLTGLVHTVQNHTL